MASSTKKPGLIARLYRGDTQFDFVGHRRYWYIISLAILVLSLGSMAVKGFNLGIEFVGGTQFQVRAAEGVTLPEAEDAVAGVGAEIASSQTAGSGGQTDYVIRTETLDGAEQDEARSALSELTGGSEVSISEVSSSWGASVSQQAVVALIVTLLLISAYLWWRYERKMSVSALTALIHDLVLTAGIYALIGFEVTPSTVIGMLTILGYSLYDTVVVFDKVDENARGAFNQQRYTYAECANLAINQTLMRSINTSIIGLLPVAGLLFVGSGLLGVGTLKDLALVLFVGMAVGTYSSLLVATPMLVDLKQREPRVKTHTRKVLSRRPSGATATPQQIEHALAQARNGDGPNKDDTDTVEVSGHDTDADIVDSDDASSESRPAAMSGAPRPGSRPSGRKPASGGGKKKKRR